MDVVSQHVSQHEQTLNNRTLCEGGEKVAVKAHLSNAKLLLNFLKSVSLCSNTSSSYPSTVSGSNPNSDRGGGGSHPALFTWTSKGLKISVDCPSKTAQANAFIDRDIFTSYVVADVHDSNDITSGDDDAESDARVAFVLDILSTVDCLSMLGQSSSSHPVLYISYCEGSDFVQLWLEESGVVVEVKARTLSPSDDLPESLDFGFIKSNVKLRIMLLSEYLKEFISDLDSSSDFIRLTVVEEPTNAENEDIENGDSRPSVTRSLIISTSSVGVGKCDIIIPEDSDLVTQFSIKKSSTQKHQSKDGVGVSKTLMDFAYKTHLFKLIIRPVSTVSDKVSLRLDERGVMCVQHLVKNHSATNVSASHSDSTNSVSKSFLQFFAIPLVLDEED